MEAGGSDTPEGSGSGFDTATPAAILEPLSFLQTDECPFARDRELAQLGTQWVTPKIVATVKFAEWTDHDRLRASVFMGIRTDLVPEGVLRDQ